MVENFYIVRVKRGVTDVFEKGVCGMDYELRSTNIGMGRWIPEGDGSATSSEVSARISPSSAKCFRRGELGSNPDAASFAFFFWRRTRC